MNGLPPLDDLNGEQVPHDVDTMLASVRESATDIIARKAYAIAITSSILSFFGSIQTVLLILWFTDTIKWPFWCVLMPIAVYYLFLLVIKKIRDVQARKASKMMDDVLLSYKDKVSTEFYEKLKAMIDSTRKGGKI